MSTVARPSPAVAGGSPARPRLGARAGLRVLPHEPVCPDCGSFEVTTQDVETGDGLTETALVCQPCGCAWPLACVCEWGVTR
jgi:hypothetical protein